MLRLALALALAGCYQPSYSECAVQCAAAADCAPGQICDGDGWCVAQDRTNRCVEPIAGTVDAPAPDGGATIDATNGSDALPGVDASVGDAPPACHPSCPGTCVAGVCSIQCAGDDACELVACPPTGACRITCSGEDSCRTVLCGTGPCEVRCTGEDSCKQGVRCEAACACEVTCTGDDACDKAAKCPTGCKAGKGCTAEGSCDRC